MRWVGFLALLPLCACWSPGDIEKLVCKVATQKQLEDKAVDEVCQVIALKFPSIHFQPDCKTDVEAVWDTIVAKCPKEKSLKALLRGKMKSLKALLRGKKKSLKAVPIPKGIEKLVCDATDKQLEGKAVDEVCKVLAAKFPNIHFQPDCKTDVGAVWDSVIAKCPKKKSLKALPFPSPEDLEKLVCKVASQKQLEDKAVDEVCQVIAAKFPSIHFQPDCNTDVEAVWDTVVAKCPKKKSLKALPFPSPEDLEKLVCKVASQKQLEDKAVDEVCQVITAKFPSIHFQPDCKTDVGAVWDTVVAKCPKPNFIMV